MAASVIAASQGPKSALRWLVVGAVALLTTGAPTRVQAVEVSKDAAEPRAQAVGQASITVDASTVVRDKLPPELFGFNVRWTHFQRDLWDADKGTVRGPVIEHLQGFPGALYRYPGGLVANYFDWERSVQPIPARVAANKKLKPAEQLPLFGVDEYASVVKAVDGRLWYTLNLGGVRLDGLPGEKPESIVAASNKRLAEHLLKTGSWRNAPHYFELGNELDRSKYQWPHAKYVSRSLSSINAISSVDDKAQFVAFLREFNWRYKPPAKEGISRYDDFIRDVLTGLPMVNDFSLHLYYDGTLNEGGKYFHIADAVDKLEKALEVARSVRGGKPVRVWITEHGRRVPSEARDESTAKVLTSNLSATLSTGDFLIAMAQQPEVAGAGWQALHGVGRQLFDASVKHSDLRPRPLYWGMRILHLDGDWAVLASKTQSQNASGYPGGYDVRGAALVNPARDTLVVWAVNRAEQPVQTQIRLAGLTAQPISMKHDFIGNKAGVSADDPQEAYELQVDGKSVAASAPEGILVATLPPSSLNRLTISLAEKKGGKP